MKTRTIFSITLILVLGLLFSCSPKQKNSDTVTEERLRFVKVAELSEQTIVRDIDYPANLLAENEVYLAPSTPGRIMKIHAEIGDKVATGKLLIEMDPTQLNTAEIQLMNLQKDMKRLDTLIQYGGVSQQQYDQMKTQLNVTKANIDLLRSNINMEAPFSGTITGKYFENGELYSGAPNTQVGKAAILIIQQTNPIKAVISIQEKYYPKIKLGMNVTLTTDIFADQTFDGKISLIYPTINATTKTFDVEITVPNATQTLKPGMYARINIKLGEETAILVPSSAVLQQLGTNLRYVMLYDNGIARKILVEEGKRINDKTEIISDKLHLGDKLIVIGHSSLEEGFKVKIAE
ncbi:MAG: efflux RND transporter periplasmic adaptor subunit [Bacteroidales bacterium]|jgi:RND family efflux transporter MFP subunit|nr:efflux RND transporter periplasmic adaptor subunit [Bacteroidales bacterium]